MIEYYHKPAAASPQSLLRARLVMAEGGSSWRMCEGWNPAGCLNWQDLNTYNDHFLLNKILMILIIIVKKLTTPEIFDNYSLITERPAHM